MISDDLLTRGVAELIVESSIRSRLASGKTLRLKQGFDPTKPDMHIGHAVGLRKLRTFQELGHQVVLIVGDWTAQIGDPSGRDESRPRLDADTVRANAATYLEQFFRVVDRSRTEVRWQSEWFGTFDLEQTLGLAGRFTLAHMLSHETFRNRYDAGAPVTILELLYPMLQGYDSVAVNADIEFGGTDQKFNILSGRTLMGQLGALPQDVLLVPLIPGLDGRKMSKSFGNTVDILAAPFDMYSRVLAMPDEVLPVLLETLTDIAPAEIEEWQRGMAQGNINPIEVKKRLARDIVTQFHSAQAAGESETAWVARFSRRETPEDMPDFVADGQIAIVDLLVGAGLARSRSEARRLIDGGGVRIEGEKVEGYDLTVGSERPVVVQVGRRKFARVHGK
ncbi:MAG TPA: tyrosine--tRNA ligase [Roseiflexaceae bacterium]|nr:tyrosine--tRNA ligase [Roseiflexaceae bacterium]